MESEVDVKIDQSDVMSIEEKIKDRFSQTKTDRMVEYITGLRLDSSDLLDRMTLDQDSVRRKYGLPSIDYKLVNMSEYERYLKELAEINGVEIKSKSDCGGFFEKYSMIGGVSFDNKKSIGVNIDKNSLKSYLKSLNILEHELIHSLQDKHFPDMPIEVREYEAYIANLNISYFKHNPGNLGLVFDFFVGGSVNHWYKEADEEWGDKIVRVWNSPEYFLKNVDGISEKEIENYKETHSVDTEK